MSKGGGSCIALMLLVTLFVSDISAQTFGIGIDIPTASLHIRSETPINSIRVDRELSVSAMGTWAVFIEDESNFGALGVYQNNTTTTVPVAYVENNGLGVALNAANFSLTNNTAAGGFLHVGTGPAGTFYAGGSGLGIFVDQNGSSDGIQVAMRNTSNTANGIRIAQDGASGNGLYIDAKNSTNNILNFVSEGVGVINSHRADSSTSVIVNMAPSVGTSYVGDGYYFKNTDFGTPEAGSDGFAFIGFTNTVSPTVGVTVYGGVLGAEQHGVGHGILINHSGSEGRNAEFNIENVKNADPALFAIHEGTGSVLIAQNQSDSIPGIVSVADISYTGADIDDHIAVEASSAPDDGYGVGVLSYGGFTGVIGSSDFALSATSVGVYSTDDVAAAGAKTFWIDHPLHPESMILKHFSVESNEVSNMYKGNAVIGQNGRVVVILPDYFDAINGDCIYQLTAIGTPRQPWIAKEVSGNRFVIAGKPNSKVSWTIFADREDRYVQRNPHRLEAEVAKKPENRGKFLMPSIYDQPAEKGIFYRETIEHKTSKLESYDKDPGLSSEEYIKYLSQEIESSSFPDIPVMQPNRQPPGEKMTIRKEIKTFDELYVK